MALPAPTPCPSYPMDIANLPDYAPAGQYQSMSPSTPSCRKDGVNHNILVLLNNFRIGFLGALNNGLSVEEIREIVIHAAVYCGFPAALEGMRVLREVYDDRHLRPRSEIPTNPPQSD